MKIYILNIICLVLFGHLPSLAQSINSNNNCDCEIVFKDMINKVESNYIGLKQLQIEGNDKVYKKRKASYTLKSKNILSKNCTGFIDEFLSYFNDGHLSAIERPKYNEEELINFKNQIKANKLSEKILLELNNNYTDKNKLINKNPLLGYWTDGKSKFLVIENKKEFRAYIVETKVEGINDGELKAIFKETEKGYKMVYYSYKYSPIYLKGNVYKDEKVFQAAHIFWKRVNADFKLSKNKIVDLKKPSLKIINPKTTLLTIPSFNRDFKSFRDFLEGNKRYIQDSKNLIIDVRGNRGGNGIYFPLIELFATNNMTGSQGLVLASNDNLSYFKRQTNNSRKIYKPVVKRIENNFGKIIDGPLYPKKKYRTRKNNIQNVAILTDVGSASATESFVLYAKLSSRKVKTFGTPTAGMIDYTSVNSILLNSGKQNIIFVYPTSTLHKDIPKNGYNKNGIIPDIIIKSDISNKVNFVSEYLNKKK